MKGRKFLLIFTILNTLAIITLVIAGLHLLFSDAFGTDISRELRVKYIEPILKKVDISHLFFNLQYSKLPCYEIVISNNNYNELMAARQEKLKDPNFNFPYKKAKFIHNGKECEVSVKLRGLFPNHWMGEKKSWRVRFPKENLFKGIRRLNLIVPADRDYLKERLAYYTAKKLGLAVPYSGFCVLKINGIYQGVYFEVEQMEKSYLIRNSKAEDANLYDGEDNYVIRNIFKDIGFWSKCRSEKASGIDDYADLYKLLDMLEAPDGVFYKNIPYLVDIDKLLRWNANSMLYFDYHQNNYHNVRLLFSPVTGRFEPLVWDCSHPQFNPNIDRLYNDLVSRILKNPEFLHRRNVILWDYLKDDVNLKDDLAFFDKLYGQTRFSFLGDSKKDISNLRFLYVMRNLRKDITAYYNTLKERLRDGYLHGSVHYNTDSPSVFLRLELISGGFSASKLDKIAVEAGEKTDLFSLYYDNNRNGLFDRSDLFIAESSRPTDKGFEIKNIDFVLYPGREVEDNTLKPIPDKHRLFIISKSEKPPVFKNITLECSNAVTKQNITPDIKMVNDEHFKFFDYQTLNPEEFTERFSLFEPTGNEGEFILKSGEHIIEETVIVADKIKVIIEPGSVLVFGSGASFISYGRIIASGTKEAPIAIQARDKSWKVMAVVGEGADGSVFSNVIVRDGSEAFINGIYFTAALAIHNAEATVSDCIFENNHGDDALNIKETTAEVKNCIFENNDFDGLDLDMATAGTVDNCRFLNNGNDGIDISYADVAIKNNIIEGCGDKGISCGEGSSPIIFNNSITGCDIGLAVKDDSKAIIINNTVVDNSVGISLYNKKPEWQKGGEAAIYNTVLENSKDIESSGDSDFSINHSIVSDSALKNDSNSVRVGTPKDSSRYSGNSEIVSEYFPEIKKEKIPIGKF